MVLEAVRPLFVIRWRHRFRCNRRCLTSCASLQLFVYQTHQNCLILVCLLPPQEGQGWKAGKGQDSTVVVGELIIVVYLDCSGSQERKTGLRHEEVQVGISMLAMQSAVATHCLSLSLLPLVFSSLIFLVPSTYPSSSAFKGLQPAQAKNRSALLPCMAFTPSASARCTAAPLL